ncbi:hypothetical protein D3C87_1279510 [compost metagenome]
MRQVVTATLAVAKLWVRTRGAAVGKVSHQACTATRSSNMGPADGIGVNCAPALVENEKNVPGTGVPSAATLRKYRCFISRAPRPSRRTSTWPASRFATKGTLPAVTSPSWSRM